jgi:hypothetical protein
VDRKAISEEIVMRTSNGLIGRLVVLACLLGAVAPAMANGVDWYASPSGNDGNTCASAASPCTIQGAINAAGTYDTVHVAQGNYTFTSNRIVIDKEGLQLIGDNSPFGSDPAANPGPNSQAANASVLKAPSKSVASGTTSGMIWVRNVKNVRVENLYIEIGSRNKEAIVATGAVNGLTILNNYAKVTAGTSAVALSVNVAAGADSSVPSTESRPAGQFVTIQGNIVEPTNSSAPKRAIATQDVVGVFKGNQVAATTQDMWIQSPTASGANPAEQRVLVFEDNWFFGRLQLYLPAASNLSSDVVIRNNHFIKAASSFSPGGIPSSLAARALGNGSEAHSLRLMGAQSVATIVEGNEFKGFGRIPECPAFQCGLNFTKIPAGHYRALWIMNRGNVVVRDNVFTPEAGQDDFTAVVVGNREVWNGSPTPKAYGVTFLRNTFNANGATAGNKAKAILFVDDNDPSGSAPGGTLQIGDGTEANANKFDAGIGWYIALDDRSCTGNDHNVSTGGCNGTSGYLIGEAIAYSGGSNTSSTKLPFKWDVSAPGNTFGGVFMPNMSQSQYDAVRAKTFDNHNKVQTTATVGNVVYGWTPPPITTGTIIFAQKVFTYTGSEFTLSATLDEDNTAACTLSLTSVTDAGNYDVTAHCVSATYNVSDTQTVTVNKGVGTITWGQLDFTYSPGVSPTVTATMDPGNVACTVTSQGNPQIGPDAGNWPVEAQCDSANYTAHAYQTAHIAKALGSVTWNPNPTEFTYDGANKSATATLTEENLSCSVIPTGGVFGPNVGSYTLRADCNGTNYTVVGASTEYRTAKINKAGQSITNFAATPANPTYANGGTFIVSATGVPASGGGSGNAVTFASTSTSVCTVSGNTVAIVAAGTCNLTANLAGNGNYNDAPQATLSVAIGMAGQAIADFAANPANPTYSSGGTFTVSATGGGSGNTVTFASTTGLVCSVSGSTVTILSAGTCSLTADQAGDGNYSAAPTATLDVVIAKANQAITNFAGPATNPTYSNGGTFAVSATGGDSGKAVTFASTTDSVCSVSNSTVTMLSAGTCSLTANQDGDTNYNAAPQVTLSVIIDKGARMVQWGTLSFDYDDATHVVTAKVADDADSTCTVDPASIGPATGSYTVTVTGCASSRFDVTGSLTNTATIGGNTSVRRTHADGSGEAFFASVADALNDSTTVAGDTLEIAPGTYSGPIVLTKGVHLVGSTGYTPSARGSRPMADDFGPSQQPAVVIDGGNASPVGISVTSASATISGLEVRNFTGNCIDAATGSNNLHVEQSVIHDCGAHAVYVNGDVAGVTINNNAIYSYGKTDSQGRGIVIWNGKKIDITIDSNDVHNESGNGCCGGIELQDGSAAGVWVTHNHVYNTRDSGMGFIQLTSGSLSDRANLITDNVVENTGRYGIEIKIPNGTGADDHDGAIVVDNNTIVAGVTAAVAGDRAGIAVIRRSYYPSYYTQVDATAGVRVTNNQISGFHTGNSDFEGYGIVVEGTSMSVSDNTVSDNDVGVQIQQGNPDSVANGDPSGVRDGDQNAHTLWFGRGNAATTCVDFGDNIYNVGTANVLNQRFQALPPGAPMTGGDVTNQRTGQTYCSITAAVAAAQDGDTIVVGAGVHVENVVVTRPVHIVGAGQGATTIVPAVFNPDCNGATPGSQGSMCDDGTASIVFLVKASDVEISGLTVDGINPNLVGHETDIAARNGIMSSTTGPAVTGFKVHDTTVKNIWLRGIYSPSTNGTFEFRDNTIDNVKADPASIAIFNYDGGGVIDHNTVTNANDAISANHSYGTTFINNVISDSGSGIHTDNNNDGAGGTLDEIAGNKVDCNVQDGYGVFVFVPYKDVSVHDNQIKGCAVGLAAFGGQEVAPFGAFATFANNTVDGAGATASVGGTVGAYVTTNILQFGYSDINAKVVLTGNVITGFDIGVVTERTSGKSLTTTAHFNRISGNGVGWDDDGDPASGSNGASDFANNWWGCNDSPDAGAGCNAASGSGTFAPWLVLSLPASPIDIARDASIQIAADFNHNSAGDTVDTSALFPNGTSITFSADNGANATSPQVTASGVATTTFSGLHAGQSTVTATFENAHPTVVVRITPAAITLDDNDGTVDGTIHRTYALATPQVVTATTDPANTAYEVTYDDGTGPTTVAPVNAGTYAVVATVTDTNYEGSVSGTLVVSKATGHVEWDDLSFTYNGSVPQVTAHIQEEPATACTVNGMVGANAGTYPVSAACTGTNYDASDSNNVTLMPQPTTIAFSHLTQAYDGSPKSVVATTSPTAGVSVAITYDGNAAPPTAVGSYAVHAAVNDPNYSGSADGTLQIVTGTSDMALVLNGPVDPIHVGEKAQYAATMLANPALHAGENYGYDIVISKSGGDALAVSDLASMEVFYNGAWVDSTSLFPDGVPFDLVGGNLVYHFPADIPGFTSGFPISSPEWTWNFRFSFATTGTYTTTATLTQGIGGAAVQPAVMASIATLVEPELPLGDIRLNMTGPLGSIETQQAADYTATMTANPALHVGELFDVHVQIAKANGSHALVESDIASMDVFYMGAWQPLPAGSFSLHNGELALDFSALAGAGFPISSPEWTWNFRATWNDTGVYTMTATVVPFGGSGDPLATAAVSTTVVAATPHLPNVALLLTGPLDNVELGDTAQYTGTLLAEPAQFDGRLFWMRVHITKTGGTHALVKDDLAKMELYQGGWMDATDVLQPALEDDGQGGLVYYFPQPYGAFPIENAVFGWNFRFTYGDTGTYTATADLIDAADANPLTATALATANVSTTVVDTPDIDLQLQGPVVGVVGQPAQYVGTLTADPLPPASDLFFVKVRLHKSTGAMQESDLAKMEIFQGGVWFDPAENGLILPFVADTNGDLIYLFPQPIPGFEDGFPINEASWSWQFRFTYADAAVYTATAQVVHADDMSAASDPVTISTDIAPEPPAVALQLNGPVAGVQVNEPASYIGRLTNTGAALSENAYVKVNVALAGDTLVPSDVTVEVLVGSDWIQGTLASDGSGGLVVDFPDTNGFPIDAAYDYTHQFRITYHKPGVFSATAQVIGTPSGDIYATAGMYTQVVPHSDVTVQVLIDPNSLHAVYDGNTHVATAMTTPTVGHPLVISYNGSSDLPKDAGTYVVVASVSQDDAPYVGSASAILVIDKAQSAVTINTVDLQQQYGATHAVGASSNPMSTGGHVEVTYNGSATVPTAVGTYTVVATLVDPNYQGQASAVLTIRDDAHITLTASGPAQALVGSAAPYTDFVPYAGAIQNAGTATSQPVHYVIAVTRIDDHNAPSGQIAIAPDDVQVCVNDPSGQQSDNKGCPNDAPESLFYSESTGALNGRAAAIFRYPINPANDAPLPGSLSQTALPPTLFRFKPGQYAVQVQLVGADNTTVYATATSGTSVPNAGIAYNGPTSGPAEDALLSTTTLTNSGGRVVQGNVIVRITLSDTGGAALSPTDAQFDYQNGDHYDTLPWTQSNGDLVTYFGPGTGFPLEDGHDATTAGRAIFHREGSYTVLYEVIDAATGTPLYASQTVTPVVIGPNMASFNLSDLQQVYNGSPHPVTVTPTPGNAMSTTTYAPSADGSCPSSEPVLAGAPTDAGTYCVSVVATAPYAGGAQGTLIVAKADATVTLDDDDGSIDGTIHRVFNGAAQVVDAAANPAVDAIAVTYNGDATPPTAAGTYSVVATVVDANHVGSASATLIVTANGGATIVLDDATNGIVTRTYDGSAQAVTATTTPNGVAYAVSYVGDGSTVYPLSATPPTNAGQYHVVATTTDANYDAVSAEGTLVIARATTGATIALDGATAGVVTRTYDGNPQVVTATTDPAGLAYAVQYAGTGATTYGPSTVPPTAVGSYDVTATVTDPNYTGVVASGALLVQAQGGGTVAFDRTDFVYNGQPQTPVATMAGDANVSCTYVYLQGTTTLAGAPADAGDYTVTADCTGANMTGTASTAFTIAKAVGNVEFGATNFTFDGTEHSTTAVIAQEPGNTTACTLADNAITHAGSTTVNASCAGDNYTASGSTTIVVSPKSVTLALSGLGTFVYDTQPHAATASVTGEVAGFPAATVVTYNDGSVVPVNAGSYGVVASLDAAATDYTAAPASGLIVIDKAPATMTLTNLAYTYDGGQKSATVTTDPIGLSTTTTYNGIGTAPSAVGSYTVVATVTDPNYVGSGSATLTISAVATSNIVVSITDGREYAQYGKKLIYTIVVQNTGTADAASVAVDDLLPVTLVDAHWTCWIIGDAACGATGDSGNLHDTAVLPAGGVLIYTLTATVNDDQSLTTDQIVNTVHAGDTSATDTTQAVIFRDGFENGGDGAQTSAAISPLNRLDDKNTLALTPPIVPRVQLLPQTWLRGVDANGRTVFEIDTLRVGSSSLMRLSISDANGDLQPGEWQPAEPFAFGLVGGIGKYQALLVGNRHSVQLALPAWAVLPVQVYTTK